MYSGVRMDFTITFQDFLIFSLDRFPNSVPFWQRESTSFVRDHMLNVALVF